MSLNAESKSTARVANAREWSTVSERERVAIYAAIRAFAEAPGDDEKIAMVRACRIYTQKMKGLA